MEEKIGKVILDTTCYPGKDLYSDGAIEDEMLAISRDFAPEEFNRVISERKSWPILYHFSHIRENILSWIPFTGEEKVLEIGSGCGAVTGALCERAKEVTCIELSMKRSKINAYRHQDQDNLKILVGNFQEIEKNLTEKYDYITLIGVFEYGESYIRSENPYVDFLRIISKHLKPDGKIILAIENRLGLKYFAGAPRITQIFTFSGSMDIREISLCAPFPRMNWESCWKTAAFLFCAFTTRIRITNFRQRFLQMRAFIPIPTEEAILYTQIRQQIFLQKVKA